MDDKNIIDIGPECFADGDLEVISYKGENFYKGCGALVTDKDDGGQSFCVKRVNHPSFLHEDFEGNVKAVFIK